MCWVIYLGKGLGQYVDWSLSKHFGAIHYRTRSHFPISVLILSTSVRMWCVILSSILKIVYIQCQMVEKFPTRLWLYERMR